jgi:hypothetical protein
LFPELLDFFLLTLQLRLTLFKPVFLLFLLPYLGLKLAAYQPPSAESDSTANRGSGAGVFHGAGYNPTRCGGSGSVDRRRPFPCGQGCGAAYKPTAQKENYESDV